MLRLAAPALIVALSACNQGDQSKAAGQSGASTVTVSGIIAQPITAARTSIGAYMQLSAKCAGADVLEGVSAQAPQKASLVATSDVDVKLVITPVKSIAVACGMPVNLRPMEQHIMVTGLDHAVTIGDRIPLTLHFKRGGDVPVTAEDRLRHQELVEIRIEQRAHDRVDAEVVVVNPLREVDHGPSVFGACRPSLGRIVSAINGGGCKAA